MTENATGASITRHSPLDVGIVVRDLEEVAAFYEHVIGLQFEQDLTLSSGVAMRRLRYGVNTVKLLKYPVDPPARGHAGGPSTATGLRYWTLTVQQMDRYLERAAARNAPVVLGPVESRPGIWIAMLEDPEGNWVELLEHRNE